MVGKVDEKGSDILDGQQSKVCKHLIFWFIFYGIAGWLLDVTRYSDHSNTANFLVLLGLSFMAFITWKD